MKLVLLLLLLLGVSSHSRGAETTQSCSIIRHPTEHSSYAPDFSGTVTFTLSQVFCATNANNSEGNFSSSWTVDPQVQPPKAKNESNLLDCEHPVDHCPVCRNTSLTLFNATSDDWGNYKVTIQKPDCSSNTSTFKVRFPHCNGSAPEPTTPNRTLVFAEPRQQGHCLTLATACYGDKDPNHYDERWTNSAGHLLCADDFAPSPSKYTCNRTDIRMCNFTESFWIHDYGKGDSGIYCVQAHSVIGSAVGNKSCVDLTVVPQPWGVAIDTSTRHIHLGTDHVSLWFKLTNYSRNSQQFINLTFLRDDEVINPTRDGYHMSTTWPDPFDSSVATIELQVHKPGSYVLHIDYTSDVHTEGSGFEPFNTQPIIVQSDRGAELTKVISCPLGGVILVCCCYSLFGIGVYCIYHYCCGSNKRIRKKRYSKYKDGEQERLTSYSDTEPDSVGTKYGTTEHRHVPRPDKTVGSPLGGNHPEIVQSILDMCVGEDIEDPELVIIAERIDADNIERLGILLLGSERKFKDIRRELTSQGDHHQPSLRLAVLKAWKQDTTIDEMRLKLVGALTELKCYDVAKVVAAKDYSHLQ